MRRRTTIVGGVRYTNWLSGNGQEDSAPEDSRGILVGWLALDPAQTVPFRRLRSSSRRWRMLDAKV